MTDNFNIITTMNMSTNSRFLKSIMKVNGTNEEKHWDNSSPPVLSVQWMQLNPNESLGFGLQNTQGTLQFLHFSLGIVLLLIGFAGVVGNGLVLFVFRRYKRLRVGGGGPLILSLALGDFIVSVLHILPAYSSFNHAWKFGEIGCEVYAGGVGLGGLASLLTLAVISADRFSVIIGFPLRGLSTKKSCVGIWLVCLLWILPPYFGWSRYCLEGLGTSCSWDYTTRTLSNRLYFIFLLLFGFCLPVSIILISYLGILLVVCKQSNQMNGISRNGVVKQTPTKTDLKASKVILMIILCFLISWTPYAVVSLIGQFGDTNYLSPLATALPALFAKASVIYNPFVYGLSHPHFRSAIRNLRMRHQNHIQ